MHRGYIKIWRKTEDSGLFQMHSTLAMFLYMLMEAAYKPTRFGTVDLERGQLSSGRHKLSKALNLSEQQVRTCLEKLHNLNMITSKATNLYTIYTIVNYSIYQDMEEPINQRATNEQPTDNQRITTNKETKHLSIKEAKPSSGYSDGFIKFWEAWPASPRKGGKSSCYKIWSAKHFDNEITDILAHIELCKTNCVWKDPQYISAPLVYLNQAKWDGAELEQLNKPFSTDDFMKRMGAK